MISKSIIFKNFKNEKKNKIKKDFILLLKEKNPVIKSLSRPYRNS